MRKRPPSCSLSPVLSPSVFLDWDDTRLGHLFDEGFYGDPREPETFPWHWQPLQCEDLEGLLPAYQVIRMLGRGSMGAVYEARHRRLGRHVALKVLPGEISDHPGTAARFRQEAETLARLAHPGIVAVYDSGETIEGHLYYAMEYVDGEDLASRMARQPIPLEEALPILLSLCQALAFLHRAGIVHRDIKPANLLLTPASPQAKLADFGLAVSVARELGLPALTRPRHTLGTLEYAAPEQLAHLPGQNVGPTADLYSLGVVAYQLLTGELPRGVFDPPSLRNPSLDPAFDAVILRVLQRDPTRRFPDAETFAAALQQAADRPLQHALKEKALRRKLNRRARWIALFAAVALLSTSSAVYAWKARRQAYQSRVEAEQAQTKTEDLLQFLLTDLRKRLEPTGNLSALDSVMSRAASHFRTEWTQASASDESTLALAQVLTLYGDVIGVRGLHAQADALYTEVIGLREGMRRRQPNQPTYAVLLLEALQDRSEHRMSGGNFTGALEDAERMDRESQTTLALWPRNPTLLQLAANADIAQGNALAYDTDRFDDAALAYHRAQSRLRLLDTDFPELGSQRHRLATLETSLGSLAEGRGAFEEMARHFAAYRDYILQEFGPESSAYSHAAFRMGVAMNKTGNHAQAETYLHDAVRLAEAELARQPGHTGALNHLRWCLGEYVRAFEAQENLEAASRYRQREAEVAAALQSATAAAPN